MEPTLMKGDGVIGKAVGASGPQAGDVLAFTNPGRWLGPAAEEGDGEHRVIRTPGDTGYLKRSGRADLGQR